MSNSSPTAIDIAAQLKTGIALHQSGDLEQAETHYHKILAAAPTHADAWHLLGLINHQRGNHARAIDHIKKAIQNNHNCSFYHNNLGAALKAAGALEEAITSYRQAINLQPDYAEAAYNLGSLLMVTGKVADAVAWFEKTLQINPSYVDALSNLAAAYNTLKRHDDAISCCEKALALNPNNAVALNNLGNAMMARKRPDRAIAYYRKSISAEMANPEAHSNLGNAYHDSGETEKALASYRHALVLNPRYGEAYNNMGILLREQGRIEEATRCYQKAMQLRPKDAEAYHNMGNILKDHGRLEKAEAMYRRALERDPASIDSHVNLGIALEERGHADEAIRSYLKAIEIDPDCAKAYGHLAHQLQHVCAWHQLEPLNETLDALTERALEEGGKPDEMPFLNLSRHADAHLNFRVARAWSREVVRLVAGVQAFHAPDCTSSQIVKRKKQKITIGYLSNNFKNHPTAHLVQGMFQHHDRNRFSVFCYSYGQDDQSRYREKIKATCDRFVDISALSHFDAAKQIHDDGVDILVDLVGYMKANRLSIPAMRPAPIQVRWLGLAGTTGADFFDYLITDAIVSPDEHIPYYSEALVHMPDCYQINDRDQVTTNGQLTRKDAGLPEEGTVFCSFCSRYKYEPVMFRTWMRILDRVPGSVLWLLGGNADAKRNLTQFASALDVDSNRLIFADKLPREDHLLRLQLADLALDTRIVNGAITTSEALWAGVPLIALKGNHFASRMSASILTAARLPELVTHSLDEYEALALRLANEPHTLVGIRQRLQRDRMQLPLFDTPRFVRHLEAAFMKMNEMYFAGQRPEKIVVANL